jgi:tetratricopeptide (TPR) repeat protein
VYCKRLIYLSAVIFAAGCSRRQDVPPARYAVLRLENLTPDQSLNWMGRAVSEVLSREIGAISSSAIYAANENFGRRPVSSPGVSTELSDALLAGANHVITGYFEMDRGILTFHLVEEEAQTGKNVRELSARGSLLEACASLARQIVATPKPYPTHNEAALRDFVQGVESDGTDMNPYQAAVAADPNFPDPYLAWAELALAHKEADTVAHVLALAQERKIDPAVIAKIQFAEANAFNDSAARTAALKRMVEADPTNAVAIQALGEAEMTLHHFAEAAAAFGKGASSARPDLTNLKAYALMFAGDEKGALESVREYQKVRPQDPNAIDSEGDVRFYFGEFAEAEKYYLASAAKDPQFNQGLELWKAAQARLMTGDLAGANEIFNRYRADREKAKDITVPVRVASWQFLTGDRTGGLAAMHRTADAASNPTIKSIAMAQAGIWELQMGHKAEAAKDAEGSIKVDQTAALIPAAIVRFGSIETAAGTAELRGRADRMFSGKAGTQVRSQAVAYALYFEKRYSEAASTWKEIYEQSNVNDATPTFLYAGALQQSGQAQEAAPLLKHMPPPSINLTPGFESLYFPQFFDWRGDHATYLKLSGNTAEPAK